MRRAILCTLLPLALGACAGSTNGAFSAPTATPGAQAPSAPAQLDLAALAHDQAALRAAVAAHTGPNAGAPWTAGTAYTLAAGPYTENSQAVAAMARRTVPASGPVSLDGLDGGALAGAYLLVARTLGPAPADPPACASPGVAGASPECLARAGSDRLLANWYARDTKTYFHVGDTSFEYRPVDAIATGCALVVAGFREQDFDKIDAGQAIVTSELKTDFDPHYGFVYSRMSATAGGPRQPSDTTTHLADQAGVAEVLLQAFDASREQQYQAGAAKALEPLLQEPVTLRGRGYLSGFDVHGPGPAAGPVDVEATLLVLEAAHHYDVADGNHYANLEEVAARAFADATSGLDLGQGLPATLVDGRPSTRSPLVTALGAAVLAELAPAASPSQ